MKTSKHIMSLKYCLIFSSMLFWKGFCFAQSAPDSSASRLSIALVGQLGIPIATFKEYTQVQGGVRFEMGYAIFKAAPSITIGGEISGTGSGVKKDIHKGAEVKTSSTLSNVPYLMVRWAPKTKKRITFYVDAAAGLTIASTETTSTIVDKATFLEQIIGAQPNDIVETVYHKQSSFSSFGYNIGAGINIRPCVSIGVRYHHINNIKYTNKDNVSIVNQKIIYPHSEIPIDMIVVTLGVSSWGLY